VKPCTGKCAAEGATNQIPDEPFDLRNGAQDQSSKWIIKGNGPPFYPASSSCMRGLRRSVPWNYAPWALILLCFIWSDLTCVRGRRRPSPNRFVACCSNVKLIGEMGGGMMVIEKTAQKNEPC
jgi:hypothetical protein